ncbi:MULTISPECIES: pyruvate kinase [unclassified Bacillus (in: firmicutes)]|uniref:pyruvate kinase n=1 Tax=unclassified Bacillus (in: firmicutes) TaxID=185979 RepID=UPI000BF00158|nr:MULTISPECIES: pyruvate kinase [unclassified Bacillus (in: firmicutes)]PEJ57867.1 pyruvate kinase [Bacillus sp. AFS002410]PEL12563.1 pyruvate kinase [Bacillus sp. AFS017336]
MRKTKIVCTIGPASESVEKLVELINAGMNVARLNFSHGSHEEHAARITSIREASEKTGRTVAILLDTKGPEIRTLDFEGGQAELKTGNEVIITTDPVVGTAEKFAVSYEGLIDDVRIGSRILIDDGLIGLEVVGIEGKDIRTKILNSGLVKNKKGVNVPNVRVNLPGITEKDISDIEFGIEQKVDFIAASFVRKASDVLEIRELLGKHNADYIQIIPKIENQEGIDNIDEILDVSDGLMVARGDMGVEIPPEEVPIVQKLLIKKCNNLGKPVITATQMLDSMQRNPRPTRAEASDVANAILDGTDAIMLSGETAAGTYPVESVSMMNSIALRIEKSLQYEELFKKRQRENKGTITDAIGQSVAATALNLKVAAIIAPTESGHTAKMISKYRPKAPILAITSDIRICRRLTLVWGVQTEYRERANSTDEMLQHAMEAAQDAKFVSNGDTVIITAGLPVGETGMTNMMKIHVVGAVIAQGQGIGRKTAAGKVVIAKSGEEAVSKVTPGSILVTNSTDKDMMPAIERAAAIITEEGGLTSHAAVVGVSLGIPVIVGVDNATNILVNGQAVTVDASRGIVSTGHKSIF